MHTSSTIWLFRMKYIIIAMVGEHIIAWYKGFVNFSWRMFYTSMNNQRVSGNIDWDPDFDESLSSLRAHMYLMYDWIYNICVWYVVLALIVLYYVHCVVFALYIVSDSGKEEQLLPIARVWTINQINQIKYVYTAMQWVGPLYRLRAHWLIYNQSKTV